MPGSMPEPRPVPIHRAGVVHLVDVVTTVAPVEDDPVVVLRDPIQALGVSELRDTSRLDARSPRDRDQPIAEERCDLRRLAASAGAPQGSTADGGHERGEEQTEDADPARVLDGEPESAEREGGGHLDRDGLALSHRLGRAAGGVGTEADRVEQERQLR